MFNPVQFYEFGKNRIGAPNTFIGGVGGTINTPALLAGKLGVSESQISNFSVIGSDVQCRITGSYGSLGTWFSGDNSNNNNAGITYFLDSNSLVTSLKSFAFYAGQQQMLIKIIKFDNCATIGASCFSGETQLSYIEDIILPNCTSSTGNSHFHTLPFLKIVYIPRMTNLGTSSGDNNVFFGIPSGVNIYAHPSLSTNNGGSPDGDLAYAISRGCTVAYVTNFTIPNPVTDLSAGTIYNTLIQLNFTPPSSTNTIDYYECYANGVFKNKIAGSGKYISGLSASTNYEIQIVAVDVFYNKSIVSNVLNISTNTTSAVPTTGLVSYYKLESNSNDSYGSNNGTDTSVSYVSGKVNNAGSYNGSTSKTVIGNPASLQLSTGSISCWIKTTSPGTAYRSIFGKTNAYNMFLNNSVFGIYSWAGTTGFKSTGRNLADGNWHHIVFVFESGTSLNYLYIDGVLKLTTSMTVLNQTSNFEIGESTPNNQKINALIDEASVYNVKLSQSQVELIYNNGLGITL